MREETRMEILKKQLTRVRLINWHYFENETISLHGSTLITGENTAGKSTVLDAIQLVLTTNTRRFNMAANEKSNRSLKGYVRCKTGTIGEIYLRKNAVISNVALEFYEEKTGNYFVIGVHMTSQDEESMVITKWYMEECRFEELSFLNGSKPSLANEFKRKGEAVRYIDQLGLARDRFKRRMGNLEDKFFDIIPKSLAFKPMDNVKDFINKFVLSEEKINVEDLRVNIETLSELEELMDKSRRKLEMLTKILEKYEAVRKKDKDILVNDMLITMARIDSLDIDIVHHKEEIEKNRQYIGLSEQDLKSCTGQLSHLADKLIELNVAISNNESSRLIEGIKRRIDELGQRIEDEKKNQQKLNGFVDAIAVLLRLLWEQQLQIISREELQSLKGTTEIDEKINVVQKLSSGLEKYMEEFRQEDASVRNRMEEMDQKITLLRKRLEDLDRRILTFPENTTKLKTAIEKEFVRQGIDSKVYVVAELLEITDERWRNAIEGYFHLQKFNLIVEPEYYKTALSVYHSYKGEIHTAGIINTRKLQVSENVDNQSLAYVIHSDNRYAKAYANYILGRVIRVEDINELEEHDIAITADCMLYQGYVARVLDRERYRNPYIGQNAYRVQIENTKKELEEATGLRKTLRERKEKLSDILESGKRLNIDWMKSVLEAPALVEHYELQYKEAQEELKKAEKDPTLIELMNQIEVCKKQKRELEAKKDSLQKKAVRLANRNEQIEQEIGRQSYERQQEQERFYEVSDQNPQESKEAQDKYSLNRKNKTPKVIAENFAPQKTQFLNEKEELLNGAGGLRDLQESFNHTFDQDFLRGMEGIRDYIDAKSKLESVELVRFQEQLRKAQEECETIFKSDFLSRMKENIENARNEFKNLNKALSDIYYGDDSYRFVLSFDKQKESLYKMITSENNIEGYNLWTASFEEEYKEEMKELFDKLMTKDDKGDKVIDEYTDYRSYLDYDIEIHKRNGAVQKFSAIYGEKSGSETQVPYYVAIAASFYQLYRLGNSVRLMLLDEAFDKMDDERITSMMEFFNSLGLQVIMATPPQKVEVIGEKVDTILTAIRIGTNSIIEEYDM
jgi:energy-coupling factor transporter ATP-binding protein EcfA2